MLTNYKWRVFPDRETLEKKRLRERREKFIRVEAMQLATDTEPSTPPQTLWDKNLSEEDRHRRQQANRIFQAARRQAAAAAATAATATAAAAAAAAAPAAAVVAVAAVAADRSMTLDR
ncbi:hypothetical protein, conserved [Eimeria tenella]|uniref:Uncharacterized protein n=1 Tax=Eimeria tenella TaxID=5802 RepID=U6KS87_EIMTE|nr:hypothetical protein, conserved [Eimeria tenella]CDJ38293.1 hypothetical protein, conserved [Eimeria tenella]|eukprot:XP_013229131.1 hypothetical protein, conserved [Eimeria tenella]